LYLGVDLGTTNSAACVFDGEQLVGVRTANGEMLTPSVVRIDRKGTVSVGARARRFLQRDPENTRSEFKRLMGSNHVCQFAAAGVTRRPEELAAEVLRTLLADVKAQLGVVPDQAVIAVPAMFELPQIKATSEAARLAGFARVETIQEPVASALASGWSADEVQGAWLVYDLGGGTFDASLLETQDGLLRVVGHDGDNFLGGRDFDMAIVDFLIQRISEETGQRIERSNPAHREIVSKLKVAAEDVKIELSRGGVSAAVLLDELELDGEPLDALELGLSSEEFETIAAPLVDRSVKVCQRLMQTHGATSLGRVVLVGGPTLMPALRRRLEAAFDAPFGVGLDPMLLVAQGAALFAATANLPLTAKTREVSGNGPQLWLQYPAMTPDTSPFLVGRRLNEAPRVEAVRFSNLDGSFESEWTAFEPDGTFACMLALKRRASNTFRVEVRLHDGTEQTASPDRITIVHGVSIGDPPLARSIGVARADDAVSVYFERGVPLPCRKTFTHRSVDNIQPTAKGFALRVPIVQGDFPFAHLCRLVGVIQIPAESLKRALPAGSVVELTLEVDRGGALSARAHIPAQDLVFEHIEHLVAPDASIDSMLALLTEQKQRAATLRGAAFRSGDKRALGLLGDFESLLATGEQELAAARGGEQDALEKARRALIDSDGVLGDAEAALAWPEVAERLTAEHLDALYWVDQYGSETEKNALRQCVQAVERAMRSRNMAGVERQLQSMERLRVTCYLRAPGVWSDLLDEAANRIDETSDARQARRLLDQGRTAEAKGDQRGLEQAVRGVWGLLPPNQSRRKLGFDSGVT